MFTKMTTLEGVIVNRYPIRRTMTAFGTLKNWAWCEHCLEWKDDNEVSFIEMKEDLYGKDLLTFACDTCNKETADSFVVSSPTRPRNR